MPRRHLHKINHFTSRFSYKTLFSVVVFLLIGIIVLLKITSKPDPTKAAWFDDAYQYRQAFTFSNSTTLTNFQVTINIGTSSLINSGKMQSDCDDIRIVDQNNRIVPHWLETGKYGCNSTSNTAVWFKASTINSTGNTYYLYYGNPTATNTQNGNQVFEFFDDFSGSTIDTTKWTNGTIAATSGTNFSQSGGLLSGGNTNRYLQSTTAFTGDYIAESRVYETTSATNGFSTVGFYASSSNSAGILSHNGTSYYRYNSTWVNFASNCTSLWTNDVIKVVGTSLEAGRFPETSGSTNNSTYLSGGISSEYFRLGARYDDGAYDQNYSTTWDWVFVRKAISSDPSPSAGAEEKSPAPLAYWQFDEGAGTAIYDSSGHSYSASMIGNTNPQWLTEDQCISGKCLKFDNDTAGVSVANQNFTSLTDYTMCSWIKPFGVHKHYTGTIMSSGDWNNTHWAFGVGQSNTAIQTRKADGVNSPNWNYNFNLNQWTFVCITRQGSAITAYANGKQVGTPYIGTTGNIISNATNTTIGRETYASGYFAFNGAIDEPKIYAYARTATEIKSDYNSRGSSHGSSANLGVSNKSGDFVNNGLVGYWKMDEGVGTTTLDTSGNNSTGTLNTVGWLAGKYGIGGSFNGTNSYIDAGTNPAFSFSTGELTFSAWVKTTSSSTIVALGRYSGSGDDYWLGLTSGKAAMSISGIGVTEPGNIVNNGSWHHLVGTRSNGKMSLYIDGVFQSSITDSNSASPTGPLMIGRFGSGSSFYWNGQIDEVRIYNRSLSPSEVQNLYNWAPGPVGYWNMEEGVGSTARDSSGNNNLGNFVGNSITFGAGTTTLGASTSLDGWDLVVGSGTTLVVWGNHNFNSLTVNSGGVVDLGQYGESGDIARGQLAITAKTITINTGGKINGYARGYGGGGGAGGHKYYDDAYCNPDSTHGIGGTGGGALDGAAGSNGYSGSCGAAGNGGNGGGFGGGSGVSAGAGGAGAGIFGGAGGNSGVGCSSGNAGYPYCVPPKAPNGLLGGYLGAGTNGDTSTDYTVTLGSGGGGGGGGMSNNGYGSGGGAGGDGGATGGNGGSSYSTGGGGGGGGAGGGSVSLTAYQNITIGGTISVSGGGNSALNGGYGAGGGVLIRSPNVTLTGATIQSYGGANQTTNGGTIKVFSTNYTGSALNTTNFPSGRVYSSTNVNLLDDSNFASGKYGKAANLNGANYIDIPYSSALNVPNSWTTSAWVYLKSTPTGYPSVFTDMYPGSESKVQFDLSFNNSANPTTGFYNASSWYRATSSSPVPLNTWTYLTGTYDGPSQTVKLYVNGVLSVATTNVPTSVGNVTTNKRIGRRWDTVDNLNGKIDEVKLYNYARTQKQIVEDMNANHPAGGSPIGSQVGYWKFDEGAGNSLYNSGTGGTLTFGASSPSWNNNGKFGKTLSFNGSGSYLTSNSDSDTYDLRTGGYSATLWAKIQNPSPNHAILVQKGASGASAAGYWFGVTTAGKLDFAISNGSSYIVNWMGGNTTVSDNNWHHLAFTWDPYFGAKLFVDGKLDGSIGVTTPVDINGTDHLRIGGYSSPGFSQNGLLDEVKIYNYSLTNDEIKLDYNRGSTIVLGSLSSGTGNTAPSSASSQEYCVPGDTASCAPPIGEWKFESVNSNTVYDTSGNGNNGTLTNSASISTGKNGKGGLTSGTQYVNITDNTGLTQFANPTTVYTAEGWIKTTDTDGALYGNSSDDGWHSCGLSGGVPVNSILNTGWGGYSGVSSATAINDNKWHHLACVFSNPNNSIYVDGILVATTSTTSGSILSSGGWGANGGVQIGTRYIPDNTYLSGSYDDVRLFNYARTPAQIAWDYNKGGPVGWWKFDECQGATVYDSSGIGNTGQITIGGISQTSLGNCSAGGSTAWGVGASGKINSSLNLDGIDDFVSMVNGVGSTLNRLTNQVTLSCWIKTTNASDSHICGQNADDYTNGYGLNYKAGMPTFSVSNGSPSVDAVAASTLTDNVWHLLTGTYDGAQVRLYVDGKLVSSANQSGNIGFDGTDFSIGEITTAGVGGAGFTYTGKIDDVRLYNYALTSTQVKTLYNNGSATFAPSSGSP